jgi:lambda family phage portal protein
MAPASKSSFPDSVSRAIYGSGGVPRLYPDRQASPRSRYDAAQDDSSNQRHWADADGLSGRQANSPDVRKKLRERARLEFDNGGNCKGAIETIAHDMIGTGPRLQLKPPAGVPEETVKFIERAFQDWCDDPAVDFADKLRLMVESELRDGEAFALLVTNPAVEHPVKLDLRLVETEQVTDPDFSLSDPGAVDGIRFDASGNPTAYSVLNDHPGDGFGWMPGQAKWWPASEVIHWFRGSRPSHARGIPRITPGLALHAHKRAYTRSVLGAARIAAMFAGVLKTNLPPENGPAVVQAYDEVPFDHDGLLTMPEGWEASQFKAEQPTATHKDFSDSLMTEFGRGIHAPRNIVTGDSSPYNYSSARLDHIIYRGAHKVARNRLHIRGNDRVFVAWFAEAVLIPGYIPNAGILPALSEWSWAWRYDAFPSIDPVKDATATEIELRTGMTTYADALADRGIDWREHFQQIGRERDMAKALGIEDLLWPDQAVAAPATTKPARQAERDTVLDDEEAAYAR